MPYVPPSGGSPLWQNIQNKPSAFTPTAHTHAAADIVQPFQTLIAENLYAGATSSGERRLLYPGAIAATGGTAGAGYSQIDFLDDDVQWAIHVNDGKLFFVYEPWNYLSLVLDASLGGNIGIGTLPSPNKRISIGGKSLIAYNPTILGALAYTDANLELYAEGVNNPNPSISFHKGGVVATSLQYRNEFDFVAVGNSGSERKLTFHDAGTWTPNLSGGSHTFSAANSGSWYRIGNLLFADFLCAVSVKDPNINGATAIVITGLPLPRAGASPPHSVGNILTFGTTATSAMIGVVDNTPNGRIRLFYQNGNAVPFSAASTSFSIHGSIAYPIS